ncbi:hypothetical protein [secondary endosymbiont of Ctenarytaina eucalypti]|uniref:Uncharacterized protein n=1 Tax=secondary endosymbiont of Ctenarytaina eucalypti TaxID=1199245 RepID=J3YR16_9ENTR|nr:hypothetical protein [secondary endosymbiont of Ctenarytaina eucalypti]AFP84423.1 hypothetical protein A359_00140 [secondary endosymbiont of Ctenarytaina eucalypti]
MVEHKKDIMLMNIQKNTEAIQDEQKEIKCAIKRVNFFLLTLALLALIVSMLVFGVCMSCKYKIDNNLKMITTEYDKLKSLEKRFKKFMP